MATGKRRATREQHEVSRRSGVLPAGWGIARPAGCGARASLSLLRDIDTPRPQLWDALSRDPDRPRDRWSCEACRRRLGLRPGLFYTKGQECHGRGTVAPCMVAPWLAGTLIGQRSGVEADRAVHTQSGPGTSFADISLMNREPRRALLVFEGVKLLLCGNPVRPIAEAVGVAQTEAPYSPGEESTATALRQRAAGSRTRGEAGRDLSGPTRRGGGERAVRRVPPSPGAPRACHPSGHRGSDRRRTSGRRSGR